MQILIEIYHFINTDSENICNRLCPEENVSFNNAAFLIKFKLCEKTYTHAKKRKEQTFRFSTNEYIHNVDAQMETLTPKSHHKDTSEHDLARLFVGIK